MADGMGGWGLTCSWGDEMVKLQCLRTCEKQPQPLWGRPGSHPHCADEETEALTGEERCPGLPAREGAEL